MHCYPRSDASICIAQKPHKIFHVVIGSEKTPAEIVGSEALTFKSGSESYVLKGLPAGVQVRLRVKISANAAAQSPVLRAVSVLGPAGAVHWSTPKEWSTGSAGKSVAVNDSPLIASNGKRLSLLAGKSRDSGATSHAVFVDGIHGDVVRDIAI